MRTARYENDLAFKATNIPLRIEALAHAEICDCVFQFGQYEAYSQEYRGDGDFEDLAEDVDDCCECRIGSAGSRF